MASVPRMRLNVSRTESVNCIDLIVIKTGGMWCCQPGEKCIDHKCTDPRIAAEEITREDWTSMAQELEPDGRKN